jgi:hypothetical protein
VTEEQTVVAIGVALSVVVAALLILLIVRRGNRIQQSLAALAERWGWQNISRPWGLGGTVAGLWNGVPVRLEHRQRYKGVPERLILTIKAQSQARLIITRRFGDHFWQRPFLMFGPPLVTPMGLADPGQFWIRSDQQMLVETLLGDSSIAPLLTQNLISQFDSVNLNVRRLRLQRALDDYQVKKHFERPMIRIGADLDFIATIAQAEWELASAVAQRLNLR